MRMLPRKSLLAALVVSALLGACSKPTPEQQIQSAKEYLQKSDSKAALIQLKNVLQQNPNQGEARFLLGTLFLHDGNPTAAEIEFRKAQAAHYPDQLTVPELAHAMLQLNQARKLVDQFGNTRLDSPLADASLQTSLATALASLGESDAAATALKAALAADATYVPALMLRARQQVAARDVDGALQTMKDILAKAPSDADAWKLQGDILLYAKGQADAAMAAYKKSTEVNPNYEIGHLALLAMLLQKNSLDEAAAVIKTLEKIAPNNLEFRYAKAQLAYKKKDYKLAKDLSRDLLRIASNNPQFLQMAGAVELQTQSFAQAEIYLLRATQAEPQNTLSQRLLVNTYLRSGQHAKALDALKSAMGKDDIDPSFYALAGEVYLQNGDNQSAERYFNKALSVDPGNVSTRTALALTHLSNGRNDTAAFAELAQLADSSAAIDADMALINAYTLRREFAQALAVIDKLEAKQPDRPLAAHLRGRIQLAQQDPGAARKSFERALAIDPSYFAAAASLAALDMADKKPADARKRFEALLAKNPKHGQALLGLAQLAALQGADKDELVSLLGKAIDADPLEIAPRLLLIDLHLRTADNKQALLAAQNAVSTVPSSPELLDALGRAQQASGDLNQAAATFTKLVDLQPLAPQSHVRLAAVQFASKNTSLAEKSLRKALEIKPDYLDAQSNLIILALNSQRYADATALAKTIQKQRPKEAAGFIFEGDIQSAQKNWTAAAAAYRTGLDAVDDPDLAIKLHAATLQSGNAAAAEHVAASWLKSHPKDTRLLAYLGDAAMARKDYATAETHLLALVRIQPNSPAVLNNLAWVSQQLGRDTALSYAERSNQLAPNQPALMDTWATLLSARGQHAKAIELQTKALKAQPANDVFRLNMAKIYLAAGEKSKARTELNLLAQKGDKFASHAEVAALIKTL